MGIGTRLTKTLVTVAVAGVPVWVCLTVGREGLEEFILRVLPWVFWGIQAIFIIVGLVALKEIWFPSEPEPAWGCGDDGF